MPLALIKVQATRRPISQDVLGLRLRAAEDNPGHPIFGPSFAKPWFIVEGSDHTTITLDHVTQFTRWLKSKGYRVAYIGKLTDRVFELGALNMHNLDPRDLGEEPDEMQKLWASLTKEQQAALLERYNMVSAQANTK